QDPWPPTRRQQRIPQELRRIRLDQDLGLEVQPCRVAEILVGRPRIAVNAAMLAPSIGIEADLEADVWTIVRGDDAARPVGQVFGAWPAQGGEILVVRFHLIELQFMVGRLEAIGRVEPCSATPWCWNRRPAHSMLTPFISTTI